MEYREVWVKSEIPMPCVIRLVQRTATQGEVGEMRAPRA